MIWALLGYLLFSGGHGMLGSDLFAKETGAVVKTVVTDDARQKEALRILGLGRKELEASLKRASGTVKQFKKADESHAAGRAELQPLLEALSAERSRAHKETLDRAFELRRALTEQEWQNAFARPKT